MPGFDRLPEEPDPIQEQESEAPEPELVQLLKDFNLFDDPDVQEIRSRVPHFSTLAHLFTVMHWNATDWVRHLGAPTAARLGTAAYNLSCLSRLDELVAFIQDSKDHEGRWNFVLLDQDLHAYSQELDSDVARGRWNTDLRRAIEREILQADSQPESHPSDVESMNIPAEIELFRDPDPAGTTKKGNVSGDRTPRSDNNESCFRKTQKRAEPFLFPLFLLNLISVVLALKYGFGLDFRFRRGSDTDAPTFSPTLSPTLNPTYPKSLAASIRIASQWSYLGR